MDYLFSILRKQFASQEKIIYSLLIVFQTGQTCMKSQENLHRGKRDYVYRKRNCQTNDFGCFWCFERTMEVGDTRLIIRQTLLACLSIFRQKEEQEVYLSHLIPMFTIDKKVYLSAPAAIILLWLYNQQTLMWRVNFASFTKLLLSIIYIHKKSGWAV